RVRGREILAEEARAGAAAVHDGDDGHAAYGQPKVWQNATDKHGRSMPVVGARRQRHLRLRACVAARYSSPMFDLRTLGPGDESVLGAFLREHIDSSMFLRSNSLAAGLVDEGKPLQGTYVAAFEGGR